MVAFDFDTIGQDRVETSSTGKNEREELPRHTGTVRQLHTFFQDGQYLDQVLWSNVDTERRRSKAVWGPKVH